MVAEPRETSTPATYPPTRIAPPLIAKPPASGGRLVGSDDTAISVDSHARLMRLPLRASINLRDEKEALCKLRKWRVLSALSAVRGGSNQTGDGHERALWCCLL